MNFKDNVIAIIGPACMFSLEPIASLAGFWNIPIITGMGDQFPSTSELSVTSSILERLQKWNKNDTAAQIIFMNKRKIHPTLTRLSYSQCGLKLFFKQFGWKHIALIIDITDLFSLTVGKFLISVNFAHMVHFEIQALATAAIIYYNIYHLGKYLEDELKGEGSMIFVKELDKNNEVIYENYLKDASKYAR
ncbi:PREDICTED: uncharacterized protein LOC108557603, partial [Nicrophorus vespilloides]|uniref:Uncharacterized protein LOC108557603 n=1 Tax=Nicrophorus vespilloides TaxID=110193 RepID=A0ABM1M529_NICVS